ncbi:hypothetical protein [Nocardia sp. CA-120079]|uniref:hypothetical protein n=1 Tax=Nocardia sp. CA-120079 TaxID=3239974 RepID=UPI003D951B9F
MTDIAQAAGGPVVVFDLLGRTGALADMSEFGHLLEDKQVRRMDRWKAFFAAIPQARVIEEHRDLVGYFAGLGYGIAYSSDCDISTIADSQEWLTRHGFPPGRVLARTPAGQSHARGVLRAKHSRNLQHRFRCEVRLVVDSDADVRDFLTGNGLPAVTYAELLEMGTREVRALVGYEVPADMSRTASVG